MREEGWVSYRGNTGQYITAYGLISEQCPPTSVGCRIKANKDTNIGELYTTLDTSIYVDWYEWSKLYDRNQLVCVYPGEYPTQTGSISSSTHYTQHAGCVKKPSGSVRCWCGGRKDCNNPETSRDIFEAFQAGDTAKLERIAGWLRKSVQPTRDPIEESECIHRQPIENDSCCKTVEEWNKSITEKEEKDIDADECSGD